jgi:hypothetical protein
MISERRPLILVGESGWSRPDFSVARHSFAILEVGREDRSGGRRYVSSVTTIFSRPSV